MCIDALFFWKGPGHCRNAYIKEFERKNYPDEYRTGTPIFEPRAKAVNGKNGEGSRA